MKNEACWISKKVSEFLLYHAPQFLTNSEHTVKGYRDALTLYFQFLQESGINPTSLNHKHFEREWIERWMVWLKEKRHNSPATCNDRLSGMRKFLEYLAGKDISVEYLWQEARKIKKQKCPKKKVSGMSRTAVAAILREPDVKTSIGRRDLTFLSLLYSTAARLDEIRSITISQIHLDACRPNISIRGKGNKVRTAFILPKTKALLMAYIKEVHGFSPNPDRLLFFSRVGNSYSALTEAALDKRIKKYAAMAHEVCKEVPSNAHAHQFRHAKASHWIEDGLNVMEVQALLGHEQIETTMVYLDVTNIDKGKALATLETETDKQLDRKWKNPDGSLVDFCGLKRKR
ncbi:MAG: site-specific integrase [Sphaerochaeta sp.]|jgi:site-specific recombinase XerD|uniref:tyrosine-type recombinase/integrase n=1 Tax=Sphaerochaeta sp. TaxID=1972642 RepID=UPI000EDDAFC8|nr:tyrosine-type recombinase/integrase [Sphaerochaeta sp.]MCK9601920.1 site-specific integrase [Sphaerochaeta sp.]MDX9825845.1 tyrosine-type recombinase/integrase [Sphaerochaeta sp.]HCU30995.1 integrase [Sphaerochaeta sp.]